MTTTRMNNSAAAFEAIAPVSRGRRAIAGVLSIRRFGILIVLAALVVLLSFISPVFLTANNLLNVLDQAAPVGIIACALTFVVISGKIDFSVGSIYGFSGVVAALTLPTLGVVGASLAALAACVVLGLINGLLVTFGGIDSFISTLVTSIIIAGLGLVVTNGSLVSAFEPGFEVLGNGYLFGISYGVWLFALAAIALTVLLAKSTLGRYLYGVGDNAKAARLSGVRVRSVVTSAFLISGLAAGLSGLLITSRTGQAQPQDGLGITISAIAAVVIGGTSIAGGRGSIWRTVVGVLLLAVIANGTNLLSINPVYQQIIQGVIILAAIVTERVTQRRGESHGM